MQSEILGASMQTLFVRLDAGEAMYAEKGYVAWLSNMDLDTGAQGGLMKG